MPGRGAYGETHSCSTLGDFQTRRSNIRVRLEDGSLGYPYTPVSYTHLEAREVALQALELGVLVDVIHQDAARATGASCSGTSRTPPGHGTLRGATSRRS